MADAHPNHPPTMHTSSDYPHELSSFLHRHPLAHMIRNPHVPSRTHRVCDVCCESIHANFYHCKDCHFHVHPLCTHLPSSLRHVIDPNHKLFLHKLSSARCSVCKADCSSLWVYGCSACKVNIHLKCLRKPFGSRENTHRPSGSRGMHHHAPPPWATWPPPNHGGFPGWGYPNYQIGYPGPVQFAHNNNHPPSLGSMFGSTMFSLVENLAIGAFSDFIFGSVGF
ncbi:uncharacterized protein LOC111453231 [Cucurbita moschata]|uniref:Uncharacterized protein LOC111453231 n=2 Tax=Cucurbita TaxID=3660 RepID=A0A6J1GDM7_CUCMO